MKIGIDIGGSHIGVGLVDDMGQIVAIEEIDIKSEDKNNIENFLKVKIVELIDRILNKTEEKIDMIGVASPGAPNNGYLENVVNLRITKMEIGQFLSNHYGVNVKMQNDAKCAGTAEMKYGALEKYEDAIFLCLGTGIGGAAFMNGKLLVGKRNIGFEFGHMIICKNGAVCRCGSKGCFDQYASMRRFKTQIKEILDINEEISGEDLLEIVSNNLSNKDILNIIDEYLENLVIGISNLINIFEPEAICLGGGFVHYEKILFTKFIEKLNNQKYLFNKGNVPKVELAKLGNNAGIIGSTLL